MFIYNINHYSIFNTRKAAIAERVIRTLRAWLHQEFWARGKYIWIDILQDIYMKYHNKIKRTIGMTPVDVTPITQFHDYNDSNIALKAWFKVDDISRITKQKAFFETGFTPNFSTELFKIIKVNLTKPVTYLLDMVFKFSFQRFNFS